MSKVKKYAVYYDEYNGYHWTQITNNIPINHVELVGNVLTKLDARR